MQIPIGRRRRAKDVGAHFVAGNTGKPFDVEHAVGRNSPPLLHRLRADTERFSEGRLAAHNAALDNENNVLQRGIHMRPEQYKRCLSNASVACLIRKQGGLVESQGMEKSGRKRPYVAQGAALKRARQERRFTQPDMKRKLHLESTQTYQHWERGSNRPDVTRWGQLGDLLGIDVHALYTGESRAMYEEEAPSGALKRDSIRPLLHEIRRHLHQISVNMELLETMVGPAATDKRVEQSGFRAPNDKERGATRK